MVIKTFRLCLHQKYTICFDHHTLNVIHEKPRVIEDIAFWEVFALLEEFEYCVQKGRVVKVLCDLEESVRLDAHTRVTLNEAEGGYNVFLCKKHLYNMVAFIEAFEHVERKLERWGVLGLEGKELACDMNTIADDMVLNELVELIEPVGADKDLNELAVEIGFYRNSVETQTADILCEDGNDVLGRDPFVLVD